MASTELRVTIRLDTRRFRLWLLFMQSVAPVIGYERAYRWGVKYGVPLLRVKMDEGKWERPFRANVDG